MNFLHQSEPHLNISELDFYRNVYENSPDMYASVCPKTRKILVLQLPKKLLKSKALRLV